MSAAGIPTTTIMAPASYAPMTTPVGAPMYNAAAMTYAPMTTIMAAPTAYAAPATVAAPASYAPMTTTMAAPMSYAAPMAVAAPAYAPITTQTASYVTAPQFMAAPAVQTSFLPQQQLIPAVAPPAAPMKLTEGIPTPEQINQQKAGYAAALEKQLKEATDTVQKETSIEKEMLKFTAEKNMALYAMQVEEKLTESMSFADEGATIRILELKKALVERKLQLDNQAHGLTMDYQMKSLQTDFAQKTYAFQQQYMKQEASLAQDFNKQVAAANTGTTYSVPAQAVPAAPAALKK